jgi:8-oxo-dGTP diphosphatase
MWQDAAHWLPMALDGFLLRLTVVLNDDNETVREVLDYSTR